MLFGSNFHILALFRKFENGRKIVKNHGLTPLRFCEISGTQKSTSFQFKMTEISSELKYLVETFEF